MSSLSTNTIILLVSISALLFVNMVLSSTAAADAYSSPSSSHKWSTWSAIISGVLLFFLLAGVVFYFNKDRIVGLMRNI